MFMHWRVEFQGMQQFFRYYLSCQKDTGKLISKWNKHIDEKLVKQRMCRIRYPKLRIIYEKAFSSSLPDTSIVADSHWICCPLSRCFYHCGKSEDMVRGC